MDVIGTMPPKQISLRDYFAGQAMSGLASDFKNFTDLFGDDAEFEIAEDSYRIADEMLIERKKQKV